MAVNEVIKKSAYRVWNELEAVWKKYALWTTGEQVECTDGQSVEDKIGAVKGVTTSTNVEEEGWIPDATLVTELSRNTTELNKKTRTISLIGNITTERGSITFDSSLYDFIRVCSYDYTRNYCDSCDIPTSILSSQSLQHRLDVGASDSAISSFSITNLSVTNGGNPGVCHIVYGIK